MCAGMCADSYIYVHMVNPVYIGVRGADAPTHSWKFAYNLSQPSSYVDSQPQIENRVDL